MRVEHAEKIAPAGIAWRAIVIGIGYLVLLAIGGAMLVSLGADLPQIENGTGLLPWTLASGVAIGLVLGSFASHISATHIRHIFVWVSLLFLNGVAVIIEGHFFVPDLISLETFPIRLSQLPFQDLFGPTFGKFFSELHRFRRFEISETLLHVGNYFFFSNYRIRSKSN